MKFIYFLFIGFSITLFSCKKVIDLYPQSNVNSGTYYETEDEIRTGLNGCYNGMQRSMFYEWQLTELRTDNSKQGVAASTASGNRDLSDLDMFLPATTHQGIYNYWQTTYNNIRNTNIILQRLNVNYDPAAGTISLGKLDIIMTDSARKQLAGEALFIRAYHYFNLVRLFGEVFLIHTPISAVEAKSINKSSVAAVYKMIETDLSTAATYLSKLKFSQINVANVGRTTNWAAKGLLGKVYLTQNKKTDAITLFQDVISNSGYGLESTYGNVFSITTEMSKEIIFTIRYKAGGLGLGSSFGNDFAALNSGSSIINGSGLGFNYPTDDLDSSYITSLSPLKYDSSRRVNTIAVFGTGTAAKLYVKKYLNQVVLTGDGESDWPIIRYADILLMMAEAQGYSSASIALINQVRARAGMPALPATVNTVALFEQALSDERRLELAFENHRFFDLVRFGTTLTTINAIDVMKNHFAKEYNRHYSQYPAPRLTLAELQAKVDANHLLLPIPQREIDTNTQLVIKQNPGY